MSARWEESAALAERTRALRPRDRTVSTCDRAVREALRRQGARKLISFCDVVARNEHHVGWWRHGRRDVVYDLVDGWPALCLAVLLADRGETGEAQRHAVAREYAAQGPEVPLCRAVTADEAGLAGPCGSETEAEDGGEPYGRTAPASSVAAALG